MDRVTLNLTIDRKAYIALHAHAAANRGTAEGSCSAIVSRLISTHLKEWRVSQHANGDEPERE